MDKVIVTAFILYFLMTVFTYGHAVNNIEICKDRKDACGAMAGILVAPAWPLYWSVKLQESNHDKQR